MGLSEVVCRRDNALRACPHESAVSGRSPLVELLKCDAGSVDIVESYIFLGWG